MNSIWVVILAPRKFAPGTFSFENPRRVRKGLSRTQEAVGRKPSECRERRAAQRKACSAFLKKSLKRGRGAGGGGIPVLFFLPNTLVLQCITKACLISFFLFKVLSGRTYEFSHKNRDRTEQKDGILPDFSGQALRCLGEAGERESSLSFAVETGAC